MIVSDSLPQDLNTKMQDIRIWATQHQHECSNAITSGVQKWTKKGWIQATDYGPCFVLPSVLWHCWLGRRKDIWPV